MSRRDSNYATAKAIFLHLVNVSACPHNTNPNTEMQPCCEGESVDLVTVDDLRMALDAIDAKDETT